MDGRAGKRNHCVTERTNFDVAIVGAGIVGLATAYQITERYPDRRVLVLEKEDRVGRHQSGHNSGVLHSGIYYTPGSLKARNCRDGKLAMEAFCTREQIPFEVCGKVIVAVDATELPRLERIYQRGQENGVRCEMIDAARLRELEPHAAGIQAIHVPDAGIVDYPRVCADSRKSSARGMGTSKQTAGSAASSKAPHRSRPIRTDENGRRTRS